MSERLSDALKNLRDVLQEESHNHCVAVDVFFSCDGYEITYRTRTPKSLIRDSISMRNLKGEFIKASD